MKVWMTIAAAAALAGCAQSSGVLKLGPDTYSVSAYAHSRFSDPHRTVLTHANQQCASEGKEIFVTNLRTQTDYADVTFRCLDADDPDLVRPIFTQAPDTVIEDRRR